MSEHSKRVTLDDHIVADLEVFGRVVERAQANNRIMRKKTINLTAVIYPDADSNWLVAQNPETGTTTQGKTFEKALANLKEATELYLSEFPLAPKGRPIMTTFEMSPPAHA